jgi:hypothetical protein
LMQGVRIEPVSIAGYRGQELQGHNGIVEMDYLQNLSSRSFQTD